MARIDPDIHYNSIILEHFNNPRNVGELENPDAVGNVGNPVCGDMTKLTLKIENGHISEAKFKTFGCGVAIASSSVLTLMLIGKSLPEVAKITNQEVATALGGLPPAKIHCSVLAEDVLKAALEDYRTRNSDEPRL